MMSLSFPRILLGLLILNLGGGLAIILVERGHQAPSPLPVTHTADWYIAHPDVLKLDEAKCIRNDNEISLVNCENVDSADSGLAPSQLQAADGGK
jgi:hypothetical protein